jgi:type VI secretion system protein ImpL
VDSPLAAYLRAVVRETTLIPPAGQEAQGIAGKLAAQAAQNKAELAKLAGVQPSAAGAAEGPIESIVDDHFAPIRRLVQGTPAPIDEVTKMFGEIHLHLEAVDSAVKSKSPPPPPAGAQRLKAAATTLPEPIRSTMAALADVGVKGGRQGEREAFTNELKPIFDFCNRAVANRYPFASGSRADVLPDDFGQLFGVGGMLDDFYQRRLAAMVDTGTNPWSYKPLPDGTATPGTAALADFQRAALIREAFFRAGGKMPGFRMDIRAVEMGEGVKEVLLDVDGQLLKFGADNTASSVVNWPGQKVSSRITLQMPGAAPISFEGPWAIFRLMDRFELRQSARPERMHLLVNHEGRRVKLEVTAGSILNPFRMREIQQFRCPGAL